jgi:tetratricopeptide (TPR) repeat protein
VARVTENARRALQLDSTLAEARVALGIMYGAVNQFERSETEFRHAIALEPTNAAAHFQLARTLLYFGRLQEGVEELERAKSLEPYHATIATWLALALARPPTNKPAVEESTRAWELDSVSAVVQLFTVMTAMETGRRNEARRITDWAPRNNFNEGAFAWVRGANGSLDPAREVIRSVEERGATGWLDQLNVSMASLILGDTARALAAMERSLERDEPVASFLPLWLPMYDPVRTSTTSARSCAASGSMRTHCWKRVAACPDRTTQPRWLRARSMSSGDV